MSHRPLTNTSSLKIAAAYSRAFQSQIYFAKPEKTTQEVIFARKVF
jgi:hypothetical protein